MFSLGGLFEVMLLCVNGMAVLQVRSIPLGSTAEMEAVCLTRLQFMLQLLWCFFCVDISTMLAYQGESARCVFANTMSASFPTHVCMCCGVCRCSVFLGLSAILLCIITLPPSSLLLHLSGRNITKDFSPNLDPKKEPMPRFLHKMGLTEEQHTFGGATSVKGKLIQGAIRT